MNCNKRQPFRRFLALGCITIALATGSHNFKNMPPSIDNSTVRVRIQSLDAAEEIINCANADDLQRHLPVFSTRLHSIASANDINGLMKLRKKIDRPMLDIMNTTRVEKGMPMADDFVFLTEMFHSTESHDEKLAIIFLALPRLYHRALVLFDLESASSLTRNMVSSEGAFLDMLDDSSDAFKRIGAILSRYWYTVDRSFPTEDDQMQFFTEFVQSYGCHSLNCPSDRAIAR
ncbi:hypothetical protein KKF81_06075 [Candidatus Micrarchaeota archaeon]|nr:hypothetical protein [Candidatus Micrarchaeota archaeon]MBU1166496.1 hypothetical protein [Candidatus Micrarchaeota archaeon]